MALADNRTDLLPSLLDRLLSETPDVQNLQAFKDTVKRDVEALLNTRQEVLEELPREFTEVRRSLMVYGLPDCTAMSLHNPDDHQRIRQALEQTITTFEPRLQRVRVTVEPPRPYDYALRFRIDALLRVEPAPEPITFDAMLQLSTRAYVVQG